MCKQNSKLYRSVPLLLAVIVFCVTVLMLPFETVHAEGDIAWQKNLDLCYVNMSGIAYGNGLYVAAGIDGTIRTSPDAVNWTSRNSGVTQHLSGVTYNGKIFVVGGTEGTIVTSSDGITWTKADLGNLDYPYSIGGFIWDGKQFIARGLYGAYGIILTSPDGYSWTTRITDIHGGFNKIAWNGSIYVAVGNQGVMYTSEDSITWVPAQSSGQDPFYDIAYNGEIFIVAGFGGKILTSSDGEEWSTINLDIVDSLDYGNFGTKTILWDGNQFVVTYTDGQILTSPDGFSWEKIATTDYKRISKIIFNNGKYIAVCGPKVLMSDDCSNWSSITIGLPVNFKAIGYNGTKFVAAGTGGIILTSSNGSDWTPVESGTTLDVNDVIWNGEEFIAVGNGGTILLSEDGTKWSTIPSGTEYNLKKAVWNGEEFLVVGDSRVILKSADGFTWIDSNIIPNPKFIFYDVIWDGNRFIVAGEYSIASPIGIIAVSQDGTDWALNIVPEALGFKNIMYTGNCYVASGGGLFKSNDLKNWDMLFAGQDWQFDFVTWDGKRFITESTTGKSSVILTSSDGLNWRSSVLGTISHINKASLLGDKYIAIGDNGIIFTGKAVNLTGDINDDGNIDAIDLALMRQYLLTNNNAGINLQNADIDKDGQLNSLDFALLKKLLL